MAYLFVCVFSEVPAIGMKMSFRKGQAYILKRRGICKNFVTRKNVLQSSEELQKPLLYCIETPRKARFYFEQKMISIREVVLLDGLFRV